MTEEEGLMLGVVCCCDYACRRSIAAPFDKGEDVEVESLEVDLSEGNDNEGSNEEQGEDSEQAVEGDDVEVQEQTRETDQDNV